MSYMQALFLVVSTAGGLYFLMRFRRFDYFSLAFFGAQAYFLPGFFGVTAYHVGGTWTDTPIAPETYWVMIFVVLSIWMSAWIASRVPPVITFKMRLSAEPWVPRLLMIASVAGLIGLLAIGGDAVFQPDKNTVMEGLGRWHILFYTAATVGLPVAYHLRQRSLAALLLAFLVFDLFIGFRAAFAVGVISFLVVLLHEQGNQRLATANWKLIPALLAFGIFLLGFKLIAFAVRAGMWDLAWSILQDSNSYYLMLTHSEPFLTQQILNEVVVNRFETTFDHILSSIYQFVIFAPELGANEVTFNSLFQAHLFPGVEYGLAANIWAQMWSAGGWWLLICFVCVFNLGLALGNRTLQARSVVLRAGLAPAFCYWAFYIHRNELGYALNLEKRHLLVIFFAIAVASILAAGAKRAPTALSDAACLR